LPIAAASRASVASATPWWKLPARSHRTILLSIWTVKRTVARRA
jgi:hypothetical protein